MRTPLAHGALSAGFEKIAYLLAFKVKCLATTAARRSTSDSYSGAVGAVMGLLVARDGELLKKKNVIMCFGKVLKIGAIPRSVLTQNGSEWLNLTNTKVSGLFSAFVKKQGRFKWPESTHLEALKYYSP
ncbi:hypothetical protein ABEB36_015755 [Hypothenemus hampei]|uniref:Uncharacterized protein n=1 Tax=Hypothenemus hampei TaxID=57062 RepID=A0ABD1DYW3_HYPHA